MTPRHLPRFLLLATLPLAVVGGCDDPPTDDAPFTCSNEQRATYWVQPPLAIDLLIVVDRTPSMAARAGALAPGLASLAGAVDAIAAGGADLHVGVVTSELAATDVAGCAWRDDGPVLRGQRCLTDGRFLRTRPRSDGSDQRNLEGGVADAVACMLDVPASSCPVSQPLAAAARALDGSVPDNDGFRRPEASLAILVLSDGDDCSLRDRGALAGGAGEAGVEVACVERADALVDVTASVRDLVARHVGGDPARLHVATVAGAGTCAPPAPRLGAAASAHADLCAADWSTTLEALVPRYLLPASCIDPALDQAPTAAGLQAECTASLRTVDGDDLGAVPWCGAIGHTSGGACVRAVPDGLACPGAFELRFEPGDGVWRPRYLLDLRCAAACQAP